MKKYKMIWMGKDEICEVWAKNGMEAYDKAYDHFTNGDDNIQIIVMFYVIYNADGSVYDDNSDWVDFVRSGKYFK